MEQDHQQDFAEQLQVLTKRVLSRATTVPYLATTTLPPMCYSCQITREPIVNCVYEPSMAFILQGGKNSIVGNREFTYGAGATFAVSVHIPSTYRFIDISPEKPFVGLHFVLDRDILSRLLEQIGADYFIAQSRQQQEASVIVDVDDPAASLMGEVSEFRLEQGSQAEAKAEQDCYGVSLDRMTPAIVDVLLQLTQLEAEGSERDKKVLGQLLISQLYYHMLMSKHGVHFFNYYYQKATHKGIIRSVEFIQKHFREDFDIDKVASEVAYMQPSSFFKHFKSSTGFTPLQFKKRLRLLAAKKLMEVEHFTVSRSAYEVGYESVAQFSRDFKQLFHVSPSSFVA